MVTCSKFGGNNPHKAFTSFIFGVIISTLISGVCSCGSTPQKGVAEATDSVSEVNGSVIVDYDESIIYSGEYVFDAVFTDATLEKSNSTITMIIDGNKISIIDGEKTLKGDIDKYLGIKANYDYGDDFHYDLCSLTPNSRDGSEWKGNYFRPGFSYEVVLKLKECKRKNEAVKITSERVE